MTAVKQPNEARVHEFDFAPQLGTESIASRLGIQVTPRGDVAQSAALQTSSEANDATRVRALVTGGTAGETYALACRVTTTAGETLEVDGEIVVLDLAFSLPKGVTSPYATAEDYVVRFGVEETVRLTDERDTGRIDAAKLGAALADATALTEAALVDRYALPLAEAPPLLKRVVADLARERLHGDRATEAVAERGRQARADLRDIAKGTLRLPLPGGAEPSSAAGGVAFVAPAAVFTDDALAGF